MIYKIKLTDQAGYAVALAAVKSKLDQPLHFLQAPFYGQWQEAAGKTVIYFLIETGGQPAGCGQAVKYQLPGGFYFYYCPYGPVCPKWEPALARALEQFFKNFEDKKLLFVRLDADNLPRRYFHAASAAAATTASLQPRAEWLLDIKPDEKTLLANMQRSGRYRIGLAERRGAVFRREDCTPTELDNFYELLLVTAERDGFHLHPKNYYQAAFDTLKENAFIGYVDMDNRPIAAAFCINYDGQTHYVFGCSSNEARKVGPGYLLQWQCILNAKHDGQKIYNFGGISGGVKG
ncbi:MAG: lipid II:glycine glycyltransferase FemX, partial [Candidatus Saccharimonadales bacterium]